MSAAGEDQGPRTCRSTSSCGSSSSSSGSGGCGCSSIIAGIRRGGGGGSSRSRRRSASAAAAVVAAAARRSAPYRTASPRSSRNPPRTPWQESLFARAPLSRLVIDSAAAEAQHRSSAPALHSLAGNSFPADFHVSCCRLAHRRHQLFISWQATLFLTISKCQLLSTCAPSSFWNVGDVLQ